ncbi:hypothetical protein AMTRI_Chr01g112610 [Amborella trichopoda]
MGMGNWFRNWWHKESPPPMVLVPPLFDFPPLAARTRMLVPAYDLLFGKLALKYLFEDYFENAGHFTTSMMLKPIDDPHVDLIATIQGPIDPKNPEAIFSNASFRWQRDPYDPHTFMEVSVSNSTNILCLRSSAYYPKYGIGVFAVLPLLAQKRVLSENFGVTGLRYGSEKLSIGATFMPFPSTDFPRNAWAVGRMGRLTAGVQYKSTLESKSPERFDDIKNWSCAIGYGLGLNSPINPSYNFGLELVGGTKLISSFYQHVVVQRRVKNPLEESEIVGITNYIDFGFELTSRINGSEPSKSLEASNIQVAASWQANKNFLVKGKLGPLSSSAALAFKSWWKPSFTFSITAVRDHLVGKTAYGFGIQMENLREASYQRADPNYVMLTPNKEHLAEGMLRDLGKRPMLQSNLISGNFDGLPQELKPIDKIL